MNEKTRILGIESSCDETAAAVVRADGVILSNVVFSQTDAHLPYGGVVPEIAARAHLEKMDHVVGEALARAGADFSAIDAIAVTAGPGLLGGVIVGVMAAKAYAAVHHKPLYAVNHLEGHALAVRMAEDIPFPFLLLLVSGGHCQLLDVRGPGEYRLLGQTKDDALGEAFDKTAKMMGLPYPGGPEIERLARSGNAARFDFPRPLRGTPGCDFSFSGLKTAVRREIITLAGDTGRLQEADMHDLAASFQAAAMDVLCERVDHAMAMVGEKEQKYLVVSGGVAANTAIREALAERAVASGFGFAAPPMTLCTDNAAMIAWAAIERLRAGLPPDGLTFEPRARWEL